MAEHTAADYAAHSRQMILEANASDVRKALETANSMTLTHADIGVMLGTFLARSMIGRSAEDNDLFLGAAVTYARMLAEDELRINAQRNPPPQMGGFGSIGADAQVIQAEPPTPEWGVLQGNAEVIRANPNPNGEWPKEVPPS